MSDKSAPDLFALEHAFPDPQAAFVVSTIRLEAAIQDATVVLDTNTLLLPYSIGKETLSQIKDTYGRLAASGRLAVPARVAREFARNRAATLARVYQQMNQRHAGDASPQRGRYPLLEGLSEFEELRETEAQMEKLRKRHLGQRAAILEKLISWQFEDPVTDAYRAILTKSIIVEPSIDRGNLVEDFDYRRRNQLPPGYKDGAKLDEGIGDLIIWHTILEIGRIQGRDVVFVSGEEKADWGHKAEGQFLYPRFELVDEFRRTSNGKHFLLAKLSDLLRAMGAEKQVVDEVRAEEAEEALPRMGHSKAEFAVIAWLLEKIPHAEIVESPMERARGVDFVVVREDDVIEVTVKSILWRNSAAEEFGLVLHRIARSAMPIASIAKPVKRLLILLFFDGEEARWFRSVVDGVDTLGIGVQIGYTNSIGEFVPVRTEGPTYFGVD